MKIENFSKECQNFCANFFGTNSFEMNFRIDELMKCALFCRFLIFGSGFYF